MLPGVPDPGLRVLGRGLELSLHDPAPQPSSPDSASQPVTRSTQPSCRRSSQLPRSWATPPGRSTEPTVVINRLTKSSPTRPASRYSYPAPGSDRGVITNGGLLTTRSNR